jgi:5'-nucleotidase
MMFMRRALVALALLAACVLHAGFAQAAGAGKKITIVYTGQTHAALYPCHCPIEPDGGVARRATFLKELRKDNPYAIVLDAGSAFAGGIFDENTKTPEMDMRRTVVNLKAMEAMGYNALAIGADELNFGYDFLRKSLTNSRLDFLSSNIKIDRVKAYIVLEVEGIRVGVIGVTDTSVVPALGKGVEALDPSVGVSQAVAEVKKLGAQVVVVLSSLDKEGLKALINTVSSIDILINSNSQNREMPVSSSFGPTLMLNSSWQGRGIGVLDIELENGKIKSTRARRVMLSSDFADDKEIQANVPVCFADSDCTKKGMVGSCRDPGTVRAACSFAAAHPVSMTVIAPNDEFISGDKKVLDYLQKLFPGLKVSYLYYPKGPAEKLIKELGLKSLPAYLFGKEVQDEPGFAGMGSNLEKRGNYFLVNPRLSGISLFLDRPRIAGRIDFFMSLYYPQAAAFIEAIREFNPVLHFIPVAQASHFDASRGDPESEELLRTVCVQKYYPKKFWDYIGCRAARINSSWWQECLPGLDPAPVSSCARSDEGRGLVKDNAALAQELKISAGPAYLVDNQQIYGSGKNVPTKNEFKKLFKK